MKTYSIMTITELDNIAKDIEADFYYGGIDTIKVKCAIIKKHKQYAYSLFLRLKRLNFVISNGLKPEFQKHIQFNINKSEEEKC